MGPVDRWTGDRWAGETGGPVTDGPVTGGPVAHRHRCIPTESVQVPKIKITYKGQLIKQQKTFKYLGFYLDSKLSFRNMLDTQMVKLRKSYSILKHIHRTFPTFFTLKMRFFQTYTWPHLYTLSTIFCILSTSNQNKINSFYRRCLRLIFCIYRVSTNDLHESLKLPTLIEKYRSCLGKRIKEYTSFRTRICGLCDVE